MGRVATQTFVGEGARVVAVDVNERAVHETVAGLEGKALPVTADVTRDGDVAVCVRTAGDHFGRPDVPVNNPRIFDEGDESAPTTTDAIWDPTMALNEKGVAFRRQHGIPDPIK